MAKKPVITPELITAGVQKNANEYSARVAALRALHEDKAYNPAIDPTVLAKNAAEASRGAVGLPSIRVYNQDGVIGGDVRAAGADPDAERQGKAKGGRRAKQEAQDEGGEAGEGQEGDGGVQEGQAAFGQQARSWSPFSKAGGGNSPERVGAGPQVEVVQAKSKQEADEIALRYAAEDSVISATVRVKYSVVVVRE
jgi:hypothetical protein